MSVLEQESNRVNKRRRLREEVEAALDTEGLSLRISSDTEAPASEGQLPMPHTLAAEVLTGPLGSSAGGRETSPQG